MSTDRFNKKRHQTSLASLLALAVSLSCLSLEALAKSSWNASKDELLLQLLGQVKHRKGKEALAVIEEQIRWHPKDAANYAIRGHLYNDMDEETAALADADKALSLEPDSCMGLMVKSGALFRANHLDEALECNSKALALEPNNSYVLEIRYAILVALRRIKDAIAIAEKRLRADPRNGATRGRLIKLLVDEKQHQKVIEQATIYLESPPTNHHKSVYLTVRADAYGKLGKYAAAEADYKSAIKVYSDALDARRALIQLYKTTGNRSAQQAQERELAAIEKDF